MSDIQSVRQAVFSADARDDRAPDSSAEPREETVSKFSRMMKNGEADSRGGSAGGGSGNSSTGGGSSGGETAQTQQQDLSAIFSNLMSGTPAQGAAAVSAAPAAASQSDLQQIVDDMVDRILVSEPKLDGSREVRISLSQTGLLPGTEISLTRDINGMLFVAITTSDSGSLQRLITARNQLEESLAKQEKGSFRIDIVDGSSEGAAAHDDQRGDRDGYA